jgi:hypothetical protein
LGLAYGRYQQGTGKWEEKEIPATLQLGCTFVNALLYLKPSLPPGCTMTKIYMLHVWIYTRNRFLLKI